MKPPETSFVIEIRASPRSSRNRIVPQEGFLKVFVTAPPVDGEANAAILKAVADYFDVSPSKVSIESGHSSKTKKLRIDGLTEEECKNKLAPHQTGLDL